VLENEPECWIQYEPVLVDAPGKVLRLVFNICASAGISPDTIIAKGAVVAALVILLERAGFRIAVEIVNAIRGSIEHEMWVPVKSADQDLDLPRLVFALAHPSMLRRIWVAHQETLSPNVRAAVCIPGGGGTPIECKPENRGDIYIGRSMLGEPQWTDTQSTTRWVVSELKKQGVQIQENEEN
jgi:hypothetical protein